MMNLASRQGGWTTNQMIFWALLLAFFLSALLKLGPVYMDNYIGVRGVLNSLAKNDLSDYTKTKLKEKIRSYSLVNNLRGSAAQSFKIEKYKDEGFIVTANYEVRVNMWGNLDVVMSFENELLTKDTPVDD